MLVSKLLVALFALPLAALAQESAAAPESTDVAAPDTGSDPAAESQAGAQPEPTSNSGNGGGGGGGKNVGADINNTGQGGNGTGNWTVAHFTAPSRTYYWVIEKENTAMWTPYTEPVNLVLFNSNPAVYSGNVTIAENIPAGTGMWKGNITGFPPGNNYLLTLALSSDPTRKIGQTDGFKIRERNTIPVLLPDTVNSATNGPVVTGNVNNTNPTNTESPAGGAAPSAPSAATTPGSGALSTYTVSTVALVGAVAVALAA